MQCAKISFSRVRESTQITSREGSNNRIVDQRGRLDYYYFISIVVEVFNLAFDLHSTTLLEDLMHGSYSRIHADGCHWPSNCFLSSCAMSAVIVSCFKLFIFKKNAIQNQQMALLVTLYTRWAKTWSNEKQHLFLNCLAVVVFFIQVYGKIVY